MFRGWALALRYVSGEMREYARKTSLIIGNAVYDSVASALDSYLDVGIFKNALKKEKA
jgi:hypothetical protein